MFSGLLQAKITLLSWRYKRFFLQTNPLPLVLFRGFCFLSLKNGNIWDPFLLAGFFIFSSPIKQRQSENKIKSRRTGKARVACALARRMTRLSRFISCGEKNTIARQMCKVGTPVLTNKYTHCFLFFRSLFTEGGHRMGPPSCKLLSCNAFGHQYWGEG